MSELTYSTRISLRAKGDFLVERLCENQTVDRYITTDLKLLRKGGEPWKQAIADAANTPRGESCATYVICGWCEQYIQLPKIDDILLNCDGTPHECPKRPEIVPLSPPRVLPQLCDTFFTEIVVAHQVVGFLTSCALVSGHEGECQPGGLCAKHGWFLEHHECFTNDPILAGGLSNVH